MNMNMNNPQMAAAMAAANQSSSSISQASQNITAPLAANGITSDQALNFGFSAQKLNQPATSAPNGVAPTTDLITSSNSLTTLQPSGVNASTTITHLTE